MEAERGKKLVNFILLQPIHLGAIILWSLHSVPCREFKKKKKQDSVRFLFLMSLLSLYSFSLLLSHLN